jgi:hypothetical protein
MMDQVEKGLKVAEEEVEGVLVEVIAIKATTLGQETGMEAVGALAGETEAEVVVTETRMTTMREGPPVKMVVVVGLSRRTGMPAKRETPKEIKLFHKATPAGEVTKMIAGELRSHLVEVIRQERRMETTPGIKTSHLLAVDHLSWASGVVHLLAVDHLSWASGVVHLATLLLAEVEDLLGEDRGETTKKSPAGGVTKMIAGERQNHPVEMRQARRMETTPGVKASHLLAVDPPS